MIYSARLFFFFSFIFLAMLVLILNTHKPIHQLNWCIFKSPHLLADKCGWRTFLLEKWLEIYLFLLCKICFTLAGKQKQKQNHRHLTKHLKGHSDINVKAKGTQFEIKVGYIFVYENVCTLKQGNGFAGSWESTCLHHIQKQYLKYTSYNEITHWDRCSWPWHCWQGTSFQVFMITLLKKKIGVIEFLHILH